MNRANAQTPTRASRHPGARIMTQPIGQGLIGNEVRLDAYWRNGFRFLALPADASRDDIKRNGQRVRTTFKRSVDRGRDAIIGTGYDDVLELNTDVVTESIGALDDPSRRVIQELFWIHDANGLDVMKRYGAASSTAREALSAAKENGGGIRAAHGLAVTLHNQALQAELQAYAGEIDTPLAIWRDALEAWASLCETPSFWEYVYARVKELEDPPRLRLTHVDEIRESLPSVLLGFNARFAEAYAREGKLDRCRAHLQLIRESRLLRSRVDSVLLETVSTLTSARLDPLISRAQAELVDSGDRKKVAVFRRSCDAILSEAEELLRLLREKLGLPENALARVQFDDLSDCVLQGLQSHVDYQDEKTMGLAFSYSMCTAGRLRRLPLSKSARLKVEQAIEKDKEVVYGEFDVKDVDPTQCWFAPGEPADPDSCIVRPVHKITEVTVSNARWKSRYIIIPRSKLAAEVHDSQVSSRTGLQLLTFALGIVGAVIAVYMSGMPGVVSAAMGGMLGFGLGMLIQTIVKQRGISSPDYPTVRIRPKSSMFGFPPYKQAKAKDFQDGAKPDDFLVQARIKAKFEIEFQNMMQGFSPYELRALRSLSLAVDDKRFSAFLLRLLEATPSERRRILSGLR